MKPFKLLTVVLTLFIALSSWSAEQSYASPTENLNKIGTTTLKWMFWTIYEGSLYSQTGKYIGIEPGLALKLDYRRDITSDRLIDTTRDQWIALRLYQEDISEPWLESLSLLWPDISKGDTVTLVVGNDFRANFYFNNALLGTLENARFTRQFFAIWLAENSSYPKLRKNLIGIE